MSNCRGLVYLARRAIFDANLAPLVCQVRTAHTVTVGSKNAPPKPRKSPLSAYQLFVKEKIASKDEEGSPADKFKRVAAEWNDMAEEDKNVYRSR